SRESSPPPWREAPASANAPWRGPPQTSCAPTASRQRATRPRRRGERAARASLGDGVPADVDEPAVLDSGWTGRLAASAGEAAVEMQSRLRSDLGTLEHLLHEVDATAGAIQLVSQQQIR